MLVTVSHCVVEKVLRAKLSFIEVGYGNMNVAHDERVATFGHDELFQEREPGECN